MKHEDGYWKLKPVCGLSNIPTAGGLVSLVTKPKWKVARPYC